MRADRHSELINIGSRRAVVKLQKCNLKIISEDDVWYNCMTAVQSSEFQPDKEADARPTLKLKGSNPPRGSRSKEQENCRNRKYSKEAAGDMDMEVEPPLPESPSNSVGPPKRFGLKSSIQTNFGDDYVFQIVAKDDWASMAVSLSTNAVKLYSPLTGQYIGELRGHTDTVNHMSFQVPSSPHILCSSSSDATIRFWDTRCFQQVSTINAGPSQEVFSFSFGGAGDHLLAAGCKSQVHLWDWRNNKQAACLEESHTEDITQVQFVPGHQNKLLSASVDGLMCLFDTSGAINEDDNLETVLNVGTSIGKVGFFGAINQKIWCLTHIETLSIWDWKESVMDVNFEDARSLASKSWTLGNVDYFVDCHYSTDGNCLWVIGGTNTGALGYFPLCCRKSQGETSEIGPAEAVFLGGHAGVVRSVLPMISPTQGRTCRSKGIFGWTGGEDGRLCCWLSDESFDTNGSFISSALVAKSQKNYRRNRHSPY